MSMMITGHTAMSSKRLHAYTLTHLHTYTLIRLHADMLTLRPWKAVCLHVYKAVAFDGPDPAPLEYTKDTS